MAKADSTINIYIASDICRQCRPIPMFDGSGKAACLRVRQAVLSASAAGSQCGGTYLDPCWVKIMSN
jgi:hypothetical protein